MKLLFLVVEVTRLLSNLIKSGFVAFSQDNALVIDGNKSKIIKGINETTEETAASVEEKLAEAMIHDAGLDETLLTEEDLLIMDTADIPMLSEEASEKMQERAEEVVKSAKNEADEIVTRAHEEVEKLRAEAYVEAENIRNQAKEEGYQAGYREGFDAAKNECEEKKAELERQIQESAVRLREKEEILIQTTEHKMVDLLCQLIPTITGVVIENQKDVLFYMINAAMRDLDNSRHFVVKVSSDDYEEVSERKEEIYGAMNPNIDLEVFEDAKLSPMQCLIETDNGMVDISLDVQLDNLKKALKLMIRE